MKRQIISCLAAALLFGGTGAAHADGLIVIHDPPPLPRPLPRPHPVFAPLEVRHHHVTATIEDLVAVTEVDQTFFNPHHRRLEGTYLFPVPRGAEIDSFSMDINGTMMEAELLDANRARQIYEDIVRRMKDPALLEYVGQGLFKVRIFPIEPRSEKRVRLRYTQLLRNDGGLVEYLYPLNTEKFSSRPLPSLSVKLDLRCRRGLRSVFSPSHEVEVRRHGPDRAVIGFEATDVRPDTDFQLYFAPDRGSDVGLDLLTYRQGPEGGHFLLLASPSARIPETGIMPKDVVFVLDTSGSMAHDGKIEQARRALLFCLANLNAGDRFEVIRFSTEAEPLFGRLVPVNAVNRQRAEDFVNRLKATGGTAIAEALGRAVAPAGAQTEEGRPYTVVFLTDGRPTIGTTNEDLILSALGEAIGDRIIRIFCFGLGTDLNTHLLDKITEKTRAASQYVLPREDIEVKVSRFYTKIDQPVLAHPELSFSGPVRVTEVHPAVLPDLFRGEQLVVFGRYTGHGDVAVSLRGTVNGRPRTFVYETRFPARAGDHAFIPRLWATRRVGYLLDQVRLHGESDELREEVTRLARTYGIVTPYTAYLIVEDEARRDVPVPVRTLQGIGGDAELRAEAGRMYAEVNRAKSGPAAVGGAQAYDALRNLRTLGYVNAVAERGQHGPAAARARKMQQAMQAQQTRYVRGRTFYLNGTEWIDSEVQIRTDAPTVRVTFNSPAYFELITRHPDVSRWLALGRNVQFLLRGTVYQVVD